MSVQYAAIRLGTECLFSAGYVRFTIATTSRLVAIRPDLRCKRPAFLYDIESRVPGSGRLRVHNLRRPFRREPDFDVTSVNYDFAALLERAEAPS